MDEFIRTFIAIEPDEKAKERLLSFLDKARKAVRGDISWTRKENLHFTLKFLGEIPKVKITEIEHLIQTISERHSVFNIGIGGVGFFPDIRKPRIFWAGIKSGQDELMSLAQDIENDCEYLGFAREKREFKAHITIARIRDPRIKSDNTLLEKLSQEDICSFSADRIILYRSDLLPAGAKYTVLKEFLLKKV
ncbi:MAG: RNA 2',3'-cyclic phosphodiesterase [Deltaproteobacteria bacterium]|nr:RNA 2',3'-cyclic phosphodiesterase [Deltaproteobacteria bacterium]